MSGDTLVSRPAIGFTILAWFMCALIMKWSDYRTDNTSHSDHARFRQKMLPSKHTCFSRYRYTTRFARGVPRTFLDFYPTY